MAVWNTFLTRYVKHHHYTELLVLYPCQYNTLEVSDCLMKLHFEGRQTIEILGYRVSKCIAGRFEESISSTFKLPCVI